MFNKKSLFALNKNDPDAIVYPDANGRLVRLTREDFASEEEFLHWKAWSDNDFHDEENSDHIQSNHTLPFDSTPEDEMASPPPDEVMEMAEQRQEQRKSAYLQTEQIRSRLTQKQFRRLWMYSVDKKTEEEIARLEGVKQSSISESISRTRKKFLASSKKTL